MSKIERDHPRDLHDVACMIRNELVKTERLMELFIEVESQLIRYPAVDAASLRERVLKITRDGV